jgi:hypothetical protein
MLPRVDEAIAAAGPLSLTKDEAGLVAAKKAVVEMVASSGFITLESTA